MRQNRGTICDLLPKARRVGGSAFGLLRQMIEASAGKPIGDSGLVTPFVASGAEALRDLS
jgi:hypothetical protein